MLFLCFNVPVIVELVSACKKIRRNLILYTVAENNVSVQTDKQTCCSSLPCKDEKKSYKKDADFLGSFGKEKNKTEKSQNILWISSQEKKKQKLTRLI